MASSIDPSRLTEVPKAPNTPPTVMGSRSAGWWIKRGTKKNGVVDIYMI